MSNGPSIDPAFADLVARYLGDALSDSDFDALNEHLRDDDTARRYFWIACRTAGQRHDYGRAPAVPPVFETPDKPAAPAALAAPGAPRVPAAREPQANFRIAPYLYTLAAILLIAAYSAVVYFHNADPSDIDPRQSHIEHPPVATLIHNTGDLRTPNGYPLEGNDYEPGEYALSSGSAEFMLTNAVNVKLRGQTRMTMHSAGVVSLSRGSASFVVPPDAVGFTVRLPDGSRVVDLGTAFRIVIDDDGRASVRVSTGSVSWITKDATESQTEPVLIAAGQSARIVDSRLVDFIESPTPVALVTSEDFNTDELAYADDASQDDLLHGLTPTTTGWNLLNHAHPDEVTDGVHGDTFDETPPTDKVQGGWTTVGATAVYDLGLGDGAGWDITSIQSIAAWNGVGFGNQAYTVEVKLDEAESYTTLATVAYQPLSDIGATLVTLTDEGGAVATGVRFIKFTANRVNDGANGGAFVLRELDVFGVESAVAAENPAPPVSTPLDPPAALAHDDPTESSDAIPNPNEPSDDQRDRSQETEVNPPTPTPLS